MRTSTWETYADGRVDLQDFISLARLERVAGKVSREEFCDTFPWPCLRVLGAAPYEETQPDTSPEQATCDTLLKDDLASDPQVCAAYHGRVSFLCKREENHFPNMISIGRAPNTDIVVSVGSVSKMHGYFLQHEGVWKISDQKSTNGTRLNGRRLKTRELAEVKDGDLVCFGPDIRCIFMLPESLYGILRLGV